VSGRAPYGEPKHVQLIYDPPLHFRPDGIFRLKDLQDPSLKKHCESAFQLD
jgi:hypothetical protein